MYRFIVQYRLALLWALIILFACGAPSRTLAELRLEDLFGYDKPIHAILFGAQAWLIIRARDTTASFPSVITKACLLSAAYGVLIEVLQKFYFEGRSYDYFDMIANAFGCLVVWLWFFSKRKQFAQ
jgi:hypothetical protein